LASLVGYYDVLGEPRLGLASKALPRLLGAALLLAVLGCRRTALPPPPALVATPAAPPAPPARGRPIALLYSSNLLGELSPCNCTLPLGGLARRATAIARARAESDAILVVDAGDLFDASRGADENRRRAALVAAAVARAGLTALTPGEHDLALGLPALRRIVAGAKLPMVSANLYAAGGDRLFDADRLVEAAGVQIGLFGVSAPPTPADAARWRAAGIEARDPVAAAREAVRSLRARGAGVVVALVHVGAPTESRRLVAAVGGIDWAVLGHSALNLESPEKVGGARLLEAMSEGKNLGRLDLHVVGGSLTFADRAQRAEIAGILADHRRQLDEYDHPLGDTDPAALLEYRATRRRQLTEAIGRETAVLAGLPEAVVGSWFENRVVPLSLEIPEDPAVAALIEGGGAGGESSPKGPPAGRRRPGVSHNGLSAGAGGHL
jgi:2',3'-cyclic-nucleotide 2'-phosphodiesterase (5'-nucleotidase family)